MSDYNKATNFTAKDSLPTGNSGKIVKGAEIDTELTAVASAIASKADVNSPNFTGTPTAPTATAGTNTTQLASTAFVKAAIDGQGLGNMATQAKSAVDITGGTIVGITDLTVADGGTGASSITANSVILGNGSSALSGNLVAPGSNGNVLTSNGTTWQSTAPAAIKGLGLGGEVWNNVTSSRTNGTTYTNNRSYPIMVTIALTASSSGGYSTEAYCNGILIARTGWSQSGGMNATATFIVPPSGTYYTTGRGFDFWNELY